MVIPPFSVRATTASINAFVPLANLSNSKTPAGLKKMKITEIEGVPVRSVVDPDHFDADPDPTSEKTGCGSGSWFRIRLCSIIY
jgi:hypothetical protein